MNTIRALLAPLQGMQLLLPNACVAEVVRGNALHEIEHAPSWLLGETEWRQRKIPLVHLETLLVLPDVKMDTSQPMLVCHSLNPQADYPFIGIMLDKMPHLLTVDLINLTGQPLETEFKRAPIQAKLMINDITAYIPDLPALERRLAAIR